MLLKLLKVILLGLLGLGFYGALSVSYTTVTGTSPCPNVFAVPACFVVLFGYSMMLLATFWQKHLKSKIIFLIGWLPVFLLAFFGSILEMSNGSTCPKSNSGLALCYVSLSLALVVAILYFITKRREV